MTATPLRSGWILGPRADVLAFTGSILLGFGVIALVRALGGGATEVPPWAFLVLVVGIDVSHVYSTAFRVYLDPQERRRRPALYWGVPLACFAVGLVLHAEGRMLFWRALAYLAVWHFVRQQWGWVAYARRRAGESGALDLRLDQCAIYAATLYPLLHWHTHLPRPFDWFLAGDFAALPAWLDPIGHGLHWALLGAWLLRQLDRARRGLGVNLAKLQVIVTTWIAWYVGIVVLASDVAFTALNVLSHGIPYLMVVWHMQRQRWDGQAGTLSRLFRPRLGALFLLALALCGYAEEWVWDRLVWHDHTQLFPGPGLELGAALLGVLVPLLAVPQATHYVLDAWIWRSGSNRDVQRLLGVEPGGPPDPRALPGG